MAAARGGPTAALTPLDRLKRSPWEFDFFQAVRLLEQAEPKRPPVGRAGPPEREVARFQADLSLAFPPSSITAFAPGEAGKPPLLTVTFLGLTGPSGVLPKHYTQQMMDLYRDVRTAERRALRDWLSLFDHRFVSLFARAWEKYRFWRAYERGESGQREPDAFTRSVLCLLGLGERPLQRRFRVELPPTEEGVEPQRLAAVPDLALAFFGGVLLQRPRSAVNLESLTRLYFGIAVTVEQFRGQWLPLPRSAQTCLGRQGTLGVDTLAGRRVWDVRSRFRLRLGPLTGPQFEEFLPDRTPVAQRKGLFLLSQLVRYFVGPGPEFDVNPVLQAADVPKCRLGAGPGLGARLGWNTWLLSGPAKQDASEPMFPACEEVRLT